MVVTVCKIRNALRQLDGRRFLAACLGLAGSACILSLNCTSMAFAQQWPTKRIQVVVPIGAGSATDLTARTVLDQVATQFGQPIVIENRPGAGNTIGMAAVA